MNQIHKNGIIILLIIHFQSFIIHSYTLPEPKKYISQSVSSFLNEMYSLTKMKNYNEKTNYNELIKLRKLRNETLKPGVLFVTHGTTTKVKKHDYFFDRNGVRNNTKYIQKLAEFTNSDFSYYFKWSGDNIHNTRIKSAEDIEKKIIITLYKHSKRYKMPVTEIPINLSAHSYGGTIMILVANSLMSKSYNVQLLITLNAPNNVDKLNYQINHINIYSEKDWIIKLFCSIYFFNNYFTLSFYGPTRVTFDNAINLKFEDFYDKIRYTYYKENKKDRVVENLYFHHGSRSEQLIIDIINKLDNIKPIKNNPILKKQHHISCTFKKNETTFTKKVVLQEYTDCFLIINSKTLEVLYKIPYTKQNYNNNYYPLKTVPLYSFSYINEYLTTFNENIIYKYDGYINILGIYGKDSVKIIMEKEKSGKIVNIIITDNRKISSDENTTFLGNQLVFNNGVKNEEKDF